MANLYLLLPVAQVVKNMMKFLPDSDPDQERCYRRDRFIAVPPPGQKIKPPDKLYAALLFTNIISLL